jgi:hypothetical protein
MGGEDRYAEFHDAHSSQPRGEFPADSQTSQPDFPDPAGIVDVMDENRNFGYEPTAPHITTNRTAGRTTSRGRLIAGAAAATVLVGGAAFGAVTMLNGSSAVASTGPTGQAAVLNDALTTASTPGTTVSSGSSTTSGATATPVRHLRDAVARLRRLGGIDGQFTFETKTGTKTLAFERGAIQSVAGQDVVVKAKDGTTWNWTLVTGSVVREDGTKTTTSSLAAGDLVFVAGPVVSGSHDARLIVIRDPQKSSGSSTTPSASTSSALS